MADGGTFGQAFVAGVIGGVMGGVGAYGMGLVGDYVASFGNPLLSYAMASVALAGGTYQTVQSFRSGQYVAGAVGAVFVAFAVASLLAGASGQGGSAMDNSPEVGGPPTEVGQPGPLEPLPEGEGYYRIPPTNEQYGRAETIDVIRKAGQRWQEKHPDHPFGVNDISLPKGGEFPGHQGHHLGIEFHVRPLRVDGLQQPVSVGQPEYSRALTQDLINTFRMDPRVTQILFNDRHVTGAMPYPGHHNHLHIRIRP